MTDFSAVVSCAVGTLEVSRRLAILDFYSWSSTEKIREWGSVNFAESGERKEREREK